MLKFFGFIILMLIIPVVFLGQSFNYVQYTTRDGLAGNMIYDMCQDKDGFLWFATENGLSRFDGKQFKNFTVKDGLPDNEVLMFFQDSKGRLWISTFSNQLCYYLNGTFYNALNDSNLANYKYLSRPYSFWESANGTVWIMATRHLFHWPRQGNLAEYPFNPPLSSRIKTQTGSIGPSWFGENPGFCFNDSIFYLANGKLNFYKKANSKSGYRELSNIRNRGDTGVVKVESDIIHSTWQSDFPRMIGTINGAVEIDSVDWRIKQKFLPGKGVCRAWVDFEGIYWFATQGDGVFKLISRTALTYKLGKEIDAVNEIFSIGKRNDSVFTGHGGSQLVIWNNGRAHPIFFSQLLPKVENSIATNRLKAIMPLPDGDLLLGFDGFLVTWNKMVKKFLPIVAVKSVEVLNDKEILVASGINVVKVNVEKLNVIETVWKERATAATFFQGKYYLGTIGGLVVKNKNGLKEDFEEFHPSFKRRIVSLVKSKNGLWVATSDSGLVEIKNNGRIGRTLSEKDGLSSNICRSLVIDGDELWVGTNRGISKVNLAAPNAPIIKYNSFNLLPNHGISVLHKQGNEILVGSSSGLTIFQELQIASNSFCSVFIDRIEGSGRVWKKDAKVALPYQNNGINIDFTGISMKSAGEIMFYYQIEGLESKWSVTTSNLISIASLPPGKFDFKLYAVNKFGVKSSVIGFTIEVATPYWRTYWFYGLAFILLLGFLYALIKFRNNRILNRIVEKNKIEKQLASLEQKALQAQMNPHFIFNSLNSIQQFILENKVEDANKFLSIFASLIRETLDNSSFSRISLNREIGYITKYLELERLRFGNIFNYTITTNGLEMDNNIELPVMLLQPYVENAVRHGMRYKKDREGLIQIDFFHENSKVICRIRDNGPGRLQSEMMKSKQHILYMSKGMDLTQRRVEILNMVQDDKVSILVRDVVNERGIVSGTEVEITIMLLTNEGND